MKKSLLKALAYGYFASLTEEMVDRLDSENYTEEERRLIIHYIDVIGDELRHKCDQLKKNLHDKEKRT